VGKAVLIGLACLGTGVALGAADPALLVPLGAFGLLVLAVVVYRPMRSNPSPEKVWIGAVILAPSQSPARVSHASLSVALAVIRR